MRSIAMARAEGMARNPSAHTDVLLRLVNAEHTLRFNVIYRENLPAAVYDAIIAHPEWRVRASLADCWHAPASQRARLAADPDARVRLTVAAGPMPFRQPVQPLPHEAYAALAADAVTYVRADAARDHRLPMERVLQLLDDESTAESAASNPVLPHRLMVRFLDEAGVAPLLPP